MLVAMSAWSVPSRPAPVSVFVAARHERLRAALLCLLEAEHCVEPLAATGDRADLLRLLGLLAPAVVVVDESVLFSDRVAVLPMLRAAAPRAAFIVVGMHDNPAFAARARRAGAHDYVRLDEAERLGPAVLGACRRSADPASVLDRGLQAADERDRDRGLARPWHDHHRTARGVDEPAGHGSK